MIGFFLLWLAPQAMALDFGSYPVPKSGAECHPLDFLSTSQSRNAEEMIRKNNPDRSHANYAGKYLLVRIPYMMESEWMIADCASGKFFKETLKGEAEFRPDSALIRVVRKSEVSWKHWNGESFNGLEEPRDKTESASAAPEKILEQRYSEVFLRHPPAGMASSTPPLCIPLDFRTYFRAQQSEAHIRKHHPDLTKPNFAGKYLLLRVELLFETIHLIADCESGRFFPETLSGNMIFRKDSTLALLLRKDAAPDLLVWSAPDWIRKPDPTTAEPREVENQLRGEAARSLISGLPNPLNHHRLEFKGLKCALDPGDATPRCGIELDDPKITERKIPIAPEASRIVYRILERYGMRSSSADSGQEFAIPRGFCSSGTGVCSLFLR